MHVNEMAFFYSLSKFYRPSMPKECHNRTVLLAVLPSTPQVILHD